MDKNTRIQTLWAAAFLGLGAIALASCGSGDDNLVDRIVDQFDIVDQIDIGSGGAERYGAIEFDWIPDRGCTYAAGISQGYATQASATSAAQSECRDERGSTCRLSTTFGTVYSGSRCGALVVGQLPGGRCFFRTDTADSSASARNSALSSCRDDGTNCKAIVAPCAATSSPSSTGGTGSGTGSGTVDGTGSGTGNGNGSGGNSAPVAGSFRDGSIQQGGTLTYSNISDQFSDPDGDRLRITASSSSPTHATVRVSGDQLIVTGEQAFTSGSVTITVTATDPGGLMASTRFAVRVTAAPAQWGYIAIIGSSCSGNGRYGWSINSGYPDQASAINAANSACSSGGGCDATRTFRNSCVGVATSERCGYWFDFANTAASAESTQLAQCQRSTGTNCRSGSRCAGTP